MRRNDLEKASIFDADENRFVADFSSLRGTFTTNWVIAGILPKHT